MAILVMSFRIERDSRHLILRLFQKIVDFAILASETQDLAPETQDWASKTQDRASETQDWASETQDRASETQDRASETQDQASKTQDLAPQKIMDDNSTPKWRIDVEWQV